MYQKTITHYISKIAVDVLFYLSILCTLLVPFAAKYVLAWVGYVDASYINRLVPFLFLSGAGCVYILFNLKKMYSSLLDGNPFIDKNVSHLRNMAVACAVIALIYIVKCILMFTLAATVIVFVFLVGTLFCLTLKDLFKQAINYKTENELTI